MKYYFTASEFENGLKCTQTQHPDGRWVVARPYNYQGFMWRFKAALEVFRGKAFPFEWR